MSKNKPGDSQNIPIEFYSDSEADRTAEQAGSPSENLSGAGPETELEYELGDAGDYEETPATGREGGSTVAGSGDLQNDPEWRRLEATLAEVQQQATNLIAEKQALYEQLLRRQAEFDNFRKRLERERLESYDRIKAETFMQLLPIVDNFERALKHAPARDDDASDGGLRTGVELIYRQLVDMLTRAGLEPVPAVGQPFDPHLHEAVTTAATDAYPENTVLEELQRGYLFNGKLLRPATVVVAAKK